MPELKFFPETHVAYVSEIGPYEKTRPRGFKRLFKWLDDHHIRATGPSLGIFYDDPTKVALENLRCDLCAPVGPDVTGEGDVRTKEVGGWKVATVTFEGEKNERAAYEEVYRWLREEGYRPADEPFVKYSNLPVTKLRAEIGVPVIAQDIMPGNRKVKNPKSAPRKTARKKVVAVKKTTARRKHATSSG